MSVGERLKKARKLANLSGEKLGDMIGVSKSQISNIEKGTSDLTRSNAIVLSDRLGVSLNWLLTGEGDMTSSKTAANSGIIGSDNFQLHGNSNQVGGQREKFQLQTALIENEHLKKEVERLEKHIKRLERLLDKQEE